MFHGHPFIFAKSEYLKKQQSGQEFKINEILLTFFYSYANMRSMGKTKISNIEMQAFID